MTTIAARKVCCLTGCILLFYEWRARELLSYAPVCPASTPSILEGEFKLLIPNGVSGRMACQILPLSGVPFGEDRKGIPRKRGEYGEAGRAYDKPLIPNS